MSGGLHVPGPGGVPDLGGRPQPSTAEVLAAQIIAVQQQVDMLFQAVMRLAIGWDVRDLIEDMQLNVEPVPGTEPAPKPESELPEMGEPETATPNRAARRAAKKGHA